MTQIKYGLSHVKVAKRTVSAEGVVSYATPIDLPGAVSFSMELNQSEVSFYADNKLYYHNQAKTSEGGDLELADVPRDILLDYLGYVKDANGGILETNSLTADKCAIMFQVETDSKARKFILYNCSLASSSEEYSTVESEVTPQTSTITVTASGEDVGDVTIFKKVLESDDEGYDTAFTTVPMPKPAA